MTVEDAIRRTGVTNVIIAGGLPINEETLAAIPSARRIICKCAAHHVADGTLALNCDGALSALSAAKRLAASDARVDGFHLDDFTVSLDAGLTAEHVARLMFENAVGQPRLPLSVTIYPFILQRPDIPAFLPYFDMLLTSLWHADQIESFPGDIARLSEMSGGKPIMLCLYMGELIEIGVDVLNPVQTLEAGMEPAALKRDFGDRLTFNGGVDTQRLLPYASRDEVIAHTRWLIDTLGAGGGYILGPGHAFQADVSLENVLAVHETALGRNL